LPYGSELITVKYTMNDKKPKKPNLEEKFWYASIYSSHSPNLVA
jgi:hypothetical protein